MATDPARDNASTDGGSSNWTGGRIVGMVLASIVGLIGLALLLGGIALIAAHAFARDDDGYFTSNDEPLQSDTYTIATEQIDLGADPADWTPDELLGNVRIRVGPTDRPVFVGIGRDPDVARYLRGVEYAELTDFADGEPRFDVHQGRAPGAPPAAQDFWDAQAQGKGEQVLNWDAEVGLWTVVVMNADAARGIAVEADVGVKIDWLIWVGVALAVVGLVITLGAVLLILAIARRAARGAA